MEKRLLTALERDAILAFLSERIGQFERGVTTARQMVRIADIPMHRNQLKYFENCVACVKTLIACVPKHVQEPEPASNADS